MINSRGVCESEDEMLISDLYLFVWVLSYELIHLDTVFSSFFSCHPSLSRSIYLTLSLSLSLCGEEKILSSVSWKICRYFYPAVSPHSFITSSHVIRTNKAWDSFQDYFVPVRR